MKKSYQFFALALLLPMSSAAAHAAETCISTFELVHDPNNSETIFLFPEGQSSGLYYIEVSAYRKGGDGIDLSAKLKAGEFRESDFSIKTVPGSGQIKETLGNNFYPLFHTKIQNDEGGLTEIAKVGFPSKRDERLEIVFDRNNTNEDVIYKVGFSHGGYACGEALKQSYTF